MGKLLTKVSALLLGSMVTLGAGAAAIIVSSDKAVSSETKASLVTPKREMNASVVASSIDLSIDGHTEEIDIDGGGYPTADPEVKYVVNYSSGGDMGSREVSVKVYSNEEEVEDMVWDEPSYDLDKGYGSFYLSFAKNGTYTVKVTSKECPSVTGTLNVVVTGVVPVAYFDYELATSYVSSGGNYVIAAGTHALYEGNFSYSEGQGAKDVTINDDVITTNDQYIVWVLQAVGDGAYKITERDDRNNYLGAVNRSSSNGTIAITGDGNADWKITYDNDKEQWEFESAGFEGKYLRYDTNKSRWVVTDSEDSKYLRPALYKINDGSSHIAALEIAKPGKTHYAIGDTFTAEGLVVNAVKTKGDQPITYRDFTPSNTKGIGFSKAIGAELNEAGSFDVTLTLNDDPSYSVTYTIDVAEYSPTRYSKITEAKAPADWRGTYLLVYENGDHSKLFDSSLGYAGITENYFEAKVADNRIDGSRDIDMRRVQIVRNFDLDGAPYVVKLPDGEYLLGNEYGMHNEPVFDAARGIASLSYGEDILSINGLPIRYNSDSERFKLYEPSASNSPVSLYKLNPTASINQEWTGFIETFNNGTKICKADGSTDVGALTASWDSVASSYKALSPDAQGMIASTTYAHSEEDYGTLADIVGRYDYIVNKYGLADFMNRKEAGLIQLTSVPNPLSASQVNNDAAVVVAVVTIATTLTFGGFFALRRRKER